VDTIYLVSDVINSIHSKQSFKFLAARAQAGEGLHIDALTHLIPVHSQHNTSF